MRPPVVNRHEKAVLTNSFVSIKNQGAPLGRAKKRRAGELLRWAVQILSHDSPPETDFFDSC